MSQSRLFSSKLKCPIFVKLVFQFSCLGINTFIVVRVSSSRTAVGSTRAVVTFHNYPKPLSECSNSCALSPYPVRCARHLLHHLAIFKQYGLKLRSNAVEMHPVKLDINFKTHVFSSSAVLKVDPGRLNSEHRFGNKRIFGVGFPAWVRPRRSRPNCIILSIIFQISFHFCFYILKQRARERPYRVGTPVANVGSGRKEKKTEWHAESTSVGSYGGFLGEP